MDRDSWRPLIEDETERAQVLRAADDIAGALPASADRALVRAYLGGDVGEDVSAAVAALGGTTPAGLFGGAAGTGWLLAHLVDGDDADAVGAAVERSILGVIDRDVGFDLGDGLVGFGVLALERGSAALAARVLDELERHAQPHDGGVGWRTAPTAAYPDGYWNLGLAHGTPGVIALLARFVAAGIEPARAQRLLDGAVGFLLTACPPRDDGRFVSILGETDLELRRVAWCHGDLGIAAALLAADRRDEALALAHAAARCPAERSGVRDAGLCHGAAGAAHLFHRLYRATGDAALGVAARHWVARAAEMPTSDTSFLTGAAGVALTLHAACSDGEPCWDRLLLLDLDPVTSGAG